MSGYAGTGRATLLRENQQSFLFQQEEVVAGMASRAFQIERITHSFQAGVAFQIFFTDVNGNPSNPGAFEIDVQTSDIDQDNQYSTVTTYTGPLNAGFSGRVELTNFFAKYIRCMLKSLTNAVYVTVLVSH